MEIPGDSGGETPQQKKLRYNAFQRRTESLIRKNAIIMLREKKKNEVIARETQLSDKNSKTVDYDKFKEYITQKNQINSHLKEFYVRELFRKLSLRQFVYARKSEDTFLNNIEKTFGPKEDMYCIWRLGSFGSNETFHANKRCYTHIHTYIL